MIAAASVSEALRKVQEQRRDVLVSDIGMPEEDGYELMKKVRAMEAEQGCKRMPALALTAYTAAEDRQRALAAGYQEHLAKPVAPLEVVAVVARLTGRLSENRGVG